MSLIPACKCNGAAQVWKSKVAHFKQNLMFQITEVVIKCHYILVLLLNRDVGRYLQLLQCALLIVMTRVSIRIQQTLSFVYEFV